MRVSHLVSNHGSIQIFTGLWAQILPGSNKIAMGTAPERYVVMSYFQEQYLPRVLGAPERKKDFLISASIVTPIPGRTFIISELDQFEHVLLFVDTYDPENLEVDGTFTLPPSHHAGLPSESISKNGVNADYGLTILGPGESFLLRTTQGKSGKLSLSESGVFSLQPCSRQDLFLLGEPAVAVTKDRGKKTARGNA